MSVGLTVAAATRMRTSPGPGFGSGSFDTSSTSGPPNREKVTARMLCLSLSAARHLDRQERFGPIRRQVGVERVDEQRQETVVPHDQTQLDDSLAAKLLQRCLKRPPADAAGTEEFTAIMHHPRHVRTPNR